MDNGRQVKRVVDEWKSPPRNVVFQPRLHRVVGNIAERMIEKMREDVRKHDQASGDPHLAHANPAQPCCKPGVRACADVTDPGGLYRHAEPS